MLGGKTPMLLLSCSYLLIVCHIFADVPLLILPLALRELLARTGFQL